MAASNKRDEEPATLNKTHVDVLSNIKDGWMLRECEVYKDEYKNCTAIRGRFHQFYVHGKALDCSTWEENFQDCKLWTREADLQAAERIISREKERIKQRLVGHYSNNVWEKRDSPPEDWNKPLPDWLQEKQAKSYLQLYQNQQLGIEPVEVEKSKGLVHEVDAFKAKIINAYPSCSIL